MVWMFLGREPDKVYTLLHSEGIENIHLVCDNTIQLVLSQIVQRHDIQIG